LARMEDRRGVHRVLVEKPEGKRSLEDLGIDGFCNIKLDLKEVEWRSMDWIDVCQDRDRWRVVVNAVMNLRVS